MREAKRNGKPATNRIKSTSTKKKISRVRRKDVGCAQKTSAVLTRVLFLLHTGIALWRVSLLYDAFYLYFLSIGVGFLLLEMVFTIAVRQGKEYKWFCPSVFFYLLSVVPCLWLLELHQLDTHMTSPLLEGGCVETIFNVTGQPAPPVFTSLPSDEETTFATGGNSRLQRSLHPLIDERHVREKRQSLSNSVRDNAFTNRTVTGKKRGRNSMMKNRKKKRKSKKRKRMRTLSSTTTLSEGLLSTPLKNLRAAPDASVSATMLKTAVQLHGSIGGNTTETAITNQTTATTVLPTIPTNITTAEPKSQTLHTIPMTAKPQASTVVPTATTTENTITPTITTQTTMASLSLQTIAPSQASTITKTTTAATTLKVTTTPTMTAKPIVATQESAKTPTAILATATTTITTTAATTTKTTSRSTSSAVEKRRSRFPDAGSVPPQTTSAVGGDDETTPTHTLNVTPFDSSPTTTTKQRLPETNKSTPPKTRSTATPTARSQTTKMTSSSTADVTTSPHSVSGSTEGKNGNNRGGIDEIGSHITEFGSNAIKYIENTSQTVNNFLNQLDPQNWLLALHQVLLFVLVIGRWLLPKGEITRDQLSQLLLVFIGVGADILEFVSETIDDDVIAVRCDPLLHYIIYAVWSWSLIQFTLVLTAAKSRKTRVGFDGDDHVTMVSNQDSCCAGSVFNNADLWGILVTMLLQDVPFLAFRLYMMIVYKQVHQMMVFFTGKNVLVVILQIYRLVVLQVERKDDSLDTATDAELQPLKGTLKRLASQARAEGSSPTGDVKNASFKSRSDGSVVVKIHLESDATLKRPRGRSRTT
uniref:Transmembrane protein 26-like n=1 Tax=Phallusia mammillata TaxID=59560 RepID=A0A6F9DV88_9ASCI|nr:transmembrane protein 26-like [Phallusia mammillata]